jgi:hypothetical protein
LSERKTYSWKKASRNLIDNITEKIFSDSGEVISANDLDESSYYNDPD